MPCQGCERSGNIDADREHVFLRFIGGEDKVGSLRGRWRTYETGVIYRTLPEFANFDAYPYWESATEEEWCAQEEAFDKAEEKSIEDDIVVLDEGETTLSAELSEDEPSQENEVDIPDESEPQLEPSDGLHTEFGAGISDAELIKGLDTNLLKNYIATNGGKVDQRWGRKRLIQEALKL